jgi:hypothetical protein
MAAVRARERARRLDLGEQDEAPPWRSSPGTIDPVVGDEPITLGQARATSDAEIDQLQDGVEEARRSRFIRG